MDYKNMCVYCCFMYTIIKQTNPKPLEPLNMDPLTMDPLTMDPLNISIVTSNTQVPIVSVRPNPPQTQAQKLASMTQALTLASTTQAPEGYAVSDVSGGVGPVFNILAAPEYLVDNVVPPAQIASAISCYLHMLYPEV